MTIQVLQTKYYGFANCGNEDMRRMQELTQYGAIRLFIYCVSPLAVYGCHNDHLSTHNTDLKLDPPLTYANRAKSTIKTHLETNKLRLMDFLNKANQKYNAHTNTTLE